MSEFNRDLMLQVREKVASAPFQMDAWHESTECGTAYCIGGWTIMLTHDESEGEEILSGFGAIAAHEFRSVGEIASDLLGCTTCLFFVEEWPEDLTEAWDDAGSYYNAGSEAKRRLVALEAIDRVIAGDGEFAEGPERVAHA